MGVRVWYTVQNADFGKLIGNLNSTFVEKVRGVVVAAFQTGVGEIDVSKSNWIHLGEGSVVIDAVVWHPEDNAEAGAIKAVLESASTSLSAKFAVELSSDLAEVIDGYPEVSLRSSPIDVRIMKSNREPGSIIPGIDDSLLPVIGGIAVVIALLAGWIACRHCSGNRTSDIKDRRLDLPDGYSKDTFIALKPPQDAVPVPVQEEKPPEEKKYRSRNRRNREPGRSGSAASLAEIELAEEPVERNEPVPGRRPSDASNLSSGDEKSGRRVRNPATSSKQRRYKPSERPRNRDRD